MGLEWGDIYTDLDRVDCDCGCSYDLNDHNICPQCGHDEFDEDI